MNDAGENVWELETRKAAINPVINVKMIIPIFFYKIIHS